MSQRISNIPLRKYRKFLEYIKCDCNRTKGGHEHWSRADLSRPITLQTHIDPVPEFIIKQHLRYLNMTRGNFLKAISEV